MNKEQAEAFAVPFPESVIRVKGGAFQARYVDHAHVTERLNEVAPGWTWQPMARDQNGLPLLHEGGLWIWLDLPDGQRMAGYGEPGVMKNHHDNMKTAISDAIKNAAMRLGVALDLWKGDEPERVEVFHAEGPEQLLTPKQLADAGLLGEVHDGATIVSEHLGEYRPPELWTVRGRMVALEVVVNRESGRKGRSSRQATAPRDSEWVEVLFKGVYETKNMDYALRLALDALDESKMAYESAACHDAERNLEEQERPTEQARSPATALEAELTVARASLKRRPTTSRRRHAVPRRRERNSDG